MDTPQELADGIDAQFETWWNGEGSGLPPKPGEDRETHMGRVAKIAWLNGAASGCSASTTNVSAAIEDPFATMDTHPLTRRVQA